MEQVEFEVREVMQPLIDFVATCPFLKTFNIDLENIGIQKQLSSKPEGGAIDYDGSVLVKDSVDTIGNRRCTRQANFELLLLRRANHNVQRKEILDFLFNFEQWVEFCQFYGLCPKLSLDKQNQVYETMSADNGAYIREWSDGTEANLYIVLLHIEYFNSYRIEEDE